MSENFYKRGSWYVHCQRCGFKRHAENIAKEWTGLLVCRDTCWEPRHPQEFIREYPERTQTVPYTNKDPVVFVDVTYGPDDNTVNEAPTDDSPLNDPSKHEE